ncbi:ABC transporter ATP-binding protein [Caldimonas thermodepolymerans]|uniref:ABC transporter ATP-binding protein n=1 Tax=Caldimonas thermodepolymerans TaxID=215580 RepID=UPI0022357DD5|nr:ABC transporter ATP-binding protein [Caldimonas thermodepolymerans]UZG44397.1 ABC transporter ATP-binding protein [Caldimonas thermodepolymerans]
MSTPALEVKNLTVGYGDTAVLRGLDLTVGTGELVALIGSNGAGKTTLLRTISGLLKPKDGSILVDGKPVHGLRPDEVVVAGFVQSPEGKQLFGSMSILENLLVGAHIPRARAVREQTLKEVFELFPILEERQKLPASTLSGGQQQMVAVGRALMAKPKVLALDEPSLGLAPIMVDRVFESIKRIRDRGTTVLVIEQNVFKVLQMADHGYVLENGRISLKGSGAELLANEHLRTTYLGM